MKSLSQIRILVMRELYGYFCSPIAYVFLIIFLVMLFPLPRSGSCRFKGCYICLRKNTVSSIVPIALRLQQAQMNRFMIDSINGKLAVTRRTRPELSFCIYFSWRRSTMLPDLVFVKAYNFIAGIDCIDE